MLTLDSLNLDGHLAIFLAVKFAERSLSVWEAEYPEDKRPQKAIEAAKSWLKDPSEEKAAAAFAAGCAAADAAAFATSYATSYAAADAADAHAASYAAWAAEKAAWAGSSIDNTHAAHAAYHAACALSTTKDTVSTMDRDNWVPVSEVLTKEDLIHEVISQNLDYILKYKLEKEQSFSKPELILEHLDEEGRNLLLFNLDILR